MFKFNGNAEKIIKNYKKNKNFYPLKEELKSFADMVFVEMDKIPTVEDKKIFLAKSLEIIYNIEDVDIEYSFSNDIPQSLDSFDC